MRTVAAFAVHILRPSPLGAGNQLEGDFHVVPVKACGVGGDLPVVVLKVKMRRVPELVGAAHRFALAGIALTILPGHLLTAPVRGVVIVAIAAPVGDLEDAANACFWLRALGGAPCGAKLVALPAVHGAPAFVGLVVEVRAVHCCRVLREGPVVVAHVAATPTATGAPRGVLVPGGASAELAVLLGRAAPALAVQRQPIALTAVNFARRDGALKGQRRAAPRRALRRLPPPPGVIPAAPLVAAPGGLPAAPAAPPAGVLPSPAAAPPSAVVVVAPAPAPAAMFAPSRFLGRICAVLLPLCEVSTWIALLLFLFSLLSLFLLLVLLLGRKEQGHLLLCYFEVLFGARHLSRALQRLEHQRLELAGVPKVPRPSWRQRRSFGRNFGFTATQRLLSQG
mmetsp:Transcript_35497/g.85035  ORF Transcript_35497/g.85035 Transcript_35497/m.85035 type:complete len:395 (+) Transcript_35497:169-1353(+)|eukprot:CAMPEP_0181413822 /NCGR_PEP_ID=MMETSP1110-20121109/9178_1 /TAXON_ID=174948 /ORGANISM="Symbiodinium sp., Strain CCMP421" /LENGTH=394 /DNA_ID=CAMNT_0023536663 /DNA_START=159 /DNA_END=1343 /DNA_ORIENTATION=+